MPQISKSVEAYNLIKSDILHLRLKPGDVISQSELSEELGVGMTPIREALKMLSNEGYLKAIPNVGFLVDSVTFRNIRELFELREIVEVRTIELVVTRGHQKDKEALLKDANFTYKFGNQESYVDYLLKNMEFHVKIANLSGNTKLVDLVKKLHEESIRVYHIGLNTYDCTDQLRDDHLKLVQSIIDNDAKTAMDISKSEILFAYKRVQESLMSQMALSQDADIDIGFSFTSPLSTNTHDDID